MKRKIVIASLFLLAYLGFLLAQLPASLVVRHLPLPPTATSRCSRALMPRHQLCSLSIMTTSP